MKEHNEQMNPRFSVIIPVYNVEAYLEKCVKSVLDQTYHSYEIILVDDGSPDNSPKICDRFCEHFPAVKVIHKENGGLSSARNAGLDCAVGEYILFLDSDDYWASKDMLQILSDKIDENQYDMILFGVKKFFQNENRIEDVYPEDVSELSGLDYNQCVKKLMECNRITASACGKAVRSRLIQENNLRFVLNQLSEDVEWTARVLAYSTSISMVPQNFYVYRQQNSSSITANVDRKNIEHILNVLEKYSAEAPDSEVNHIMKNYLANQYVLLLTVSTRVDTAHIRDLLDRMKQLWYLLDYDWYPYVRKVKKLKFLGFSTVRYLLGSYKKFKKLRVKF